MLREESVEHKGVTYKLRKEFPDMSPSVLLRYGLPWLEFLEYKCKDSPYRVGLVCELIDSNSLAKTCSPDVEAKLQEAYRQQRVFKELCEYWGIRVSY